MRPRSLRARVTVVGVITLALVLGLGAWVTVRALEAALRADTSTQNEEVIDRLEASILEGTEPEALLLPVATDGTEFLIFDDKGLLLNASFLQFPVTQTFEFSPEELEEQLPLDAPPPGVQVFEIIEGRDGDLEVILGEVISGLPRDAITNENDFVDSGNWFESRRAIVTPDGSELTVFAITPFGIIGRSVDRLSLALAIIVPLLVLVGGAAIWFAIGAALRPVQRISDEAARIAPSNSRGRLPVPNSRDEIADLTVTLNSMLDRLDAGLVRQRQFVSDASHELRSPLTAVKGSAELLDMHQELPADVQPTVAALRRGTARLEAVLDDLTQLADGGSHPDIQRVHLDELIDEEIAEIRATRNEEVSIVVNAQPGTIDASPTQLRRVMTNLVTNATDHADSTVKIVATMGEEQVVITVDDDGDGIQASDRDRVFERFVRLDDARTRSTGGSGLGLALVASIVEDHGGTVRVEASEELGGARFMVSLPLSHGTR